MSARSQAQQYPLVGTRSQAPMTDNVPVTLPAVITGANPTPVIIGCDAYLEALLVIAVTAVAGTSPSLTMVLETTPDGGITWAPIGPAIPAITAIGVFSYPYGSTTAGGPFGYQVRLRNLAPTGTGSPSFTVAAWFLGK